MNDSAFFIVGLSYLFAIISPGPSLAIILKNSLNYSRKCGFFTAIGTVTGIAFQSFYVLTGLTFFQNNPKILFTLNIALGFYLIYLGVKLFLCIINDKIHLSLSKVESSIPNNYQAFKEGFLVDILNPLALVFFLAIFSSYIKPNEEYFSKFLYWVEIVTIGFLWFISVSMILSHYLVRELFLLKLGKMINIIICCIFCFLGLRLLFNAIYPI